MNKTTYNTFLSEIKTELVNFVIKYNIPADCKFPQDENDDTQWTLKLGDKYGNVNVLFESFNNLPNNEKESNTFTISMKFWDCNENHKKVFNFDCGNINIQDGTLILFSKENGLEDVKSTFKHILEIWSKEHKERKPPISMIISN